MQDAQFRTVLASGVDDGGTRSSIKDRVVDAWRDMRGSIQRLQSENPSEARLLFYVMFSDLIFFVCWTLKTVVSPTAAAAERLPVEIGLWIVMALMVRTALMYAFSAFMCVLCRVFGGQGDWHGTRLAVFWGALVAAPFGVLAAAITVGISHLEPIFPALQSDLVAVPPYYVGLVPFIWFIAVGVAEAHKFTRVAFLFAFLSALAVMLTIIGFYLRARGYI